ncbi:MAG TPA: GNAT family N-acetyltransferase [Ktedonobacterales bacterium]|nr:GNAT family N-acetyltransferase [Ktedonobacterales bacterium]
MEQLLTTRLWPPAEDAHVWVDAGGALVCVAALWARGQASPHVGLVLFSQPGDLALTVEDAALAWASRRAATRAKELACDVSLGTATFEDEPARTALLERHGFTLSEGYNTYMGCSLDAATLDERPLSGYTIQQAAESDLAPYTALFNQVFAPMTPGHRLELLRHPDYLHLVAVAPDGTLVAFCELSFSSAEWARGGPRYGWVDYIGTLEAHQRRGVGQALLAEGLRWLRARGGTGVALITMGSNAQAQSVYVRAGFYRAGRDFMMVKSVLNSAP